LRYPRVVRLSRGKQSGLARPRRQSRNVILLALVCVNVIAFVVQLFVEASQPGFVREYLALSNRGVRDAYSWEFITATLLHGGPWHFVGNVIVLYVLGRDIESILGQRHFLYLFLSGAIGGEFGHLFLMPSETVLYGASGGVAAVLIAYATILPELDLFAWHSKFFNLRLNANHLVYAMTFVSLVMLMVDRHGAIIHSAIPGGLAAGWLYANLLGFGHPSWFQRKLSERRAAAERLDRMSRSEFLELEIDPLLEKISRTGIESLTRAERRILARAREKVG
jgi:membrane associated rhomboid family serine protease